MILLVIFFTAEDVVNSTTKYIPAEIVSRVEVKSKLYYRYYIIIYIYIYIFNPSYNIEQCNRCSGKVNL